MADITFAKGDILFSQVQTIVNPIGCDGTVPCHLSKRFFARFRGMWERYQNFCERELLEPGKLWIYTGKSHRVLNFPIRGKEADSFDISSVEKGLQKFLATYQEKEISSISFPLLCGDNADSHKEEVKDMMVSYLGKCDIPTTIYEEYTPQSEIMIPSLSRLCGTLSEETIKELKTQICFEFD